MKLHLVLTGTDDIFDADEDFMWNVWISVWKMALMVLMMYLVMECILCYEVRTGTDGTFWDIT